MYLHCLCWSVKLFCIQFIPFLEPNLWRRHCPALLTSLSSRCRSSSDSCALLLQGLTRLGPQSGWDKGGWGLDNVIKTPGYCYWLWMHHKIAGFVQVGSWWSCKFSAVGRNSVYCFNLWLRYATNMTEIAESSVSWQLLHLVLSVSEEPNWGCKVNNPSVFKGHIWPLSLLVPLLSHSQRQRKIYSRKLVRLPPPLLPNICEKCAYWFGCVWFVLRLSFLCVQWNNAKTMLWDHCW